MLVKFIYVIYVSKNVIKIVMDFDLGQLLWRVYYHFLCLYYIYILKQNM